MSHEFNLDSTWSDEPSERRFDLMIQSVTTGLDKSEQSELDHLSPASANEQDLEQMEAAAAAFDLAIGSTNHDIMPDDIHDRLLIAAGIQLGNERTSNRPTPQPHQNPLETDKVELSKRRSTHASIRWTEVIALTVAAASLMLMLSGIRPFERPVASASSSFDRMEQFIDSRPNDLIDVAWTPVHAPLASGKVVWSDDRQEGYMVFSGLDKNDPAIEQYQLWIFDNDPEQKTPTDGGVFDIRPSDVGPDGTAVVPINATVPVGRAVQFAVTVETPGGVYVSKRERIPVLATVDSE